MHVCVLLVQNITKDFMHMCLLQTPMAAADAVLMAHNEFPGRQLRGSSVLATTSEEQSKRIPTVFAPFYAGARFELAGRETPPGTTLHLSNITFMVANATYEK